MFPAESSFVSIHENRQQVSARSFDIRQFRRFPAVLILFFLLPAMNSTLLLAQQVHQIDINADYIEFDSDLGNNAKRLMGNVTFKHEDVYMTCDSAYYYSEENMVDAYSHVHLWQGDTLDLYGDFLKYRGDIRMANVRDNVILIDKESRLTTDYVDYDFNADLAYYVGGGRIVNGDNTLESIRGNYYSTQKLFFFKDSVVVTNPDYTMYSDTLKYNSLTEIAYFLGPTDIISDSNYIYCENGWYDTKNNISQFNKNAWLESQGKTIKGDSLYYERETGLGKAFKNVILVDTAQNIILKGNEAIYLEKTKYALLTNKALMIQVDDQQDSLFVHADTLKSVPDTIPDFNIIKAYNHVKLFRDDMQGKCDSLVYTDTDSVFRFFGEPVIWSEENQITAEFIDLYIKNQQADKMEMNNDAFIISREDSARYNQIKGRSMTGYIRDNALTQIDVNGNSQTIYYARDGNKYIGVNKAESSDLRIKFKSNKVDFIIYLVNPALVYYPLDKFPENERLLKNFHWFGEFRPYTKEDVFKWKASIVPKPQDTTEPGQTGASEPDKGSE